MTVPNIPIPSIEIPQISKIGMIQSSYQTNIQNQNRQSNKTRNEQQLMEQSKQQQVFGVISEHTLQKYKQFQIEEKDQIKQSIEILQRMQRQFGQIHVENSRILKHIDNECRNQQEDNSSISVLNFQSNMGTK